MNQHGAEKAPAVGGSTFLIRIQFRQNACWQGTVQWLDQKKSLPFRSLLEMVLLVQEALDQAQAAGAEVRFLSWEDKQEVV